ncbi:MAG: hypothetical protein GZ086_03910 [Gelidibacter sp.]|nr:hypothetical protein [Gelidibacter sp.]
MLNTSKKESFKFCCYIFLQLVVIFIGTNIYSQSYTKINTFTTNEGLPSNHIYDIIQDNNGFLWITSDNGISRFDGRHFQNFSIKDGLPSNDVLQVIKDGNGTIWINCYKEVPAYFDEQKNRFVPYKNSKVLDEISKSLLIFGQLPNGNVRFYNSIGSAIFKNKTLVNGTIYKVKGTRQLIYCNNKELSLSVYPFLQKNKTYDVKYLVYENEKKIDSFLINQKAITSSFFTDDNKIYEFSDNKTISRIADFKLNPIQHSIEIVNLPEIIDWYKFSEKYLSVISVKGTIYILNKKTLKIHQTLTLGLAINSAFIDKNNNLWIGTLDKGLLYYSNTSIRNLNFSAHNISTNFLSIALNKTGEVFAGNYQGQILESKNDFYINHTIISNNKKTWVRKIIIASGKIIAINDAGYSINFKENKSIFNNENTQYSLKTASALNDSILLIGTTSGLIQLNLNDQKWNTLNSPKDRILNIVKANENTFYFIGPEGVYKYNYLNSTYETISLDKELRVDKPSVLAFSKKNILWVSTVSGNLYQLYNDKIIRKINNNLDLPENSTCLLPVEDNLWIASKSGIYVLNKVKNNFSISKLSKSDGLPSNVINDLANFNDTIYAATENGIAVIPSNFQIPKFSISPKLIAIKINQQDFPLAKSYDLKENQTNVALEFSGVELSGHFKNFQYSINNNKWNNLEGNTLNIQLNTGKNDLSVRAIDVNNKISNKQLEIKFSIAIPFYKTIWFWSLIIFTITAVLFWVFNRLKFARQKNAYEQQLALDKQRNKITADLHDDIGSALSSLQINSAIANILINKNTKEAQKVLNKIEDQSKNLADKIGDIIWSMKPGKDEFMTMSSRIKNFTNEILGSTHINYKINIDGIVDHKITDIASRKNIVLLTKEAINNTVKYSKATQITINLHLDGNIIMLEIIDNGIGFDTSKISGNGLTNMRKRVEELNGGFTITSKPEQGTIISASFPLVP